MLVTIVNCIFYSSARCGAGKTTWACEVMGRISGKYLYVVDRRVVAPDRTALIKGHAAALNISPTVSSVFSDDDAKVKQVENVARRIEAIPATYADIDHVVVIITHAGLKRADLSSFTGWSIIVDEVPSILEQISVRTGAMSTWLDANYALSPAADGHGHHVRFKGAFTLTELRAPSSRYWVDFHTMVLHGDARVSVGAWEERGSFVAWRNWSVSRLDAFDRVYMLGDSFLETEAALMMKATDPTIQFADIDVIAERDRLREWAKRSVIIRYFSESRASMTTLTNKEFEPQLQKVGQWLAANSTDDHLWTCSLPIAPVLAGCGIKGQKVSPMQAGANNYRHMTSATMIYAARPGDDEIAVMSRWGITEAQITGYRERYALKQFMMRTAMRVPEDSRALDFRVYDKAQASDLAAYLMDSYGAEPVLFYENVGIDAPSETRAKKRQPPKTIEQKRRADRVRQRNHRAKKAA